MNADFYKLFDIPSKSIQLLPEEVFPEPVECVNYMPDFTETGRAIFPLSIESHQSRGAWR